MYYAVSTLNYSVFYWATSPIYMSTLFDTNDIHLITGRHTSTVPNFAQSCNCHFTLSETGMQCLAMNLWKQSRNSFVDISSTTSKGAALTMQHEKGLPKLSQ